MGKQLRVILSTGFAMFSMFFGAGNVVFPLDLGRTAGSMNFYAIMGLLITAVGVPFTGLLTMFLFEGDYTKFFGRIGKIPGFLISVLLMALIGPFYAMPRCITLSFSTLQMYLPGVNLFVFTLVSCAFLYLFTIKRRGILDLLGTILSPVLLVSLVVLIIKGLISPANTPVVDYSRSSIFMYGLKEGYLTMDLMGAFFFSIVILLGLQRALGNKIDTKSKEGRKRFYFITLVSSALAAFLIAVVYTGFSYVTSFNASALNAVLAQKDTILSILSYRLLGLYGGVIANVAVSLACLTTAITLTAVFAEFLQKKVFKNRFNYRTCLILTLVLTMALSNLGFMAIIGIGMPVLLVCYPVLILITFLNLLYKLFDFKPIKIPVLVAFIISLIFYLK